MAELAQDYTIIDEPRPTRLSRLVVNPFLILVSFVLLQGINSLWFLFNTFAMKSPTRWKEVRLVAVWFGIGVVIAIGIAVGFDMATGSPQVPEEYRQMARIPRRVIELYVAYRLHQYQAGPYRLLRHRREEA